MVTPTITAPGSEALPAPAAEPEVLNAVQPDAAPATPSAPVASPEASVPIVPGAPQQRESVSTPQAPDELATLRRQVAEYEAERQRQATETALTQESQEVYREALVRGLTEEDATWTAQRYHMVARRATEEQQRIRQEQAYFQGKQNAAASIGREYGVDPIILMTGDSPQSMRAIAEREKRYAAQDARLKALEQDRVKPQTLNASTGSRAGTIGVTPDNIDKLWFDHEQAHPGAVNPYDAQYRKLLGMG